MSNIPDENWLTGNFSDGENKCCAKGHLIRLLGEEPTNFSFKNCSPNGAGWREVSKLEDNMRKFTYNRWNKSVGMISVNDNSLSNMYNDETPKGRILHVLRDMHNSGY